MHRPTDPAVDTAASPEVAAFIARWAASSGAERANKDSFLVELCDVLGVPRPEPVTGDFDADRYVFEKDALLAHEGGRVSTGKVDLYKHGCFILEAKQGSEAGASKLGTAKRGTAMWALAMQEAYGQALGYAQTFDAPPPFLVVCDIGYCFDLYASFDGSRHYRDFPDAQRHRVFLKDLPRHLDTLRAIFTDPYRLDPAKRAARVTREIAGHLAELARTLEAAGHSGEVIAKILMRSIFTMFAEDVGLLPERLFTDSLEKRWIPDPASFKPEVESLWETMNSGGKLFGVGTVKQFNGGLFAEPTALALTRPQLERLLEAARTSWDDVEPSIFGTLLERALDPAERHALGAHFTPRAYVERLVRPTIEEPLRADWDVVRAEVRQLVEGGKEAEAVASVRAFHRQLCQVRVLDPACGTGNFLYVTLDLFKRLESEVLGLLADLGETQAVLELEGATVTPGQFHGLEIKPWAKEIAELVLWIGYLQWQLRTTGDAGHLPEPVLRAYGNIECRDAVLEYDRIDPVLDDAGQPVTRWDGITTKKHPVTGKDVPDDTARVAVVRYVNPRKAEWPEAEFVVGNPPFLGKLRMLSVFGEGYAEALRDTWGDEVPDSADFVMYWWSQAARKTARGEVRRFGLVTTNSITQIFNRRVVEDVLAGHPPVHLAFAIPDHPWVETANGAAVRIAMTVGTSSRVVGRLAVVSAESATYGGEGAVSVSLNERRGDINADLSIGASVTSVVQLAANAGLASMGPMLGSRGFLVDAAQRATILACDGPLAREVIRPIRNGRDLLHQPRELFAIDLHGRGADQLKKALPATYQWLHDRVLPERATNNDPKLRLHWWLFRRSNELWRRMLQDLDRHVLTVETAKHRVFFLQDRSVIGEHGTISIALADGFFLGVLSSSIHCCWALAAGGHLGIGNDPRYNKTRCFDPFPFPLASDDQRGRIRVLAEDLDAHRKRQQSLHPDLTITGMYNVLAKLRSGEELTAKDKVIHEQGLVSVLKQLHDELDAAVFDAYNWPHDLTDEQILERLVALNAERAEEERNGLIRWLRPEYQNPAGTTTQVGMGFTERADEAEGDNAAEAPRTPWPKTLPERISAVRDVVSASARACGLDDVTAAFTGARRKDVEAVLDSLASLGLLLTFEAAGERRWRAGERGGG